jgi:hypothetical protein
MDQSSYQPTDTTGTPGHQPLDSPVDPSIDGVQQPPTDPHQKRRHSPNDPTSSEPEG